MRSKYPRKLMAKPARGPMPTGTPKPYKPVADVRVDGLGRAHHTNGWVGNQFDDPFKSEGHE